MAFATPIARASSKETADVSTHTVALPDGSNVAGRLVVVYAAVDGNRTFDWPDGWTEIQRTGSVGNSNALAFRVIDGTEGFDGVGDTIQFDTYDTTPALSADESAHRSWLIIGHAASTSPPESGGNAGTSTLPNPPSKAASWGSADNLFLACCCADHGDRTFSDFPDNYTDMFSDNTGGANGQAIATCERQLAASSDDPSTFTLDASVAWRVFTAVIRPGSEGLTVSTPGPPLAAQVM